MDNLAVVREGARVDKDIIHVAYSMNLPVWMKLQRISFIIVWNVAGELHSPKNMTIGSNSPQLVQNMVHSSPSLIHMLIPQQRLSTVKNLAPQRWVGMSEMRGRG